MNVRIARKHPQPRRGGFTLIELLVVISIIAVLASLILPGVQNARASARRLQCFNNMRNVGLAVVNYSSMNGGALPPLSGGIDSYYLNAAGGAAVYGPAPWTVHLLPYLEQAGLYDRLTAKQPPTATAAQLLSNTQTLQNTNIKVFTCPDDPTADQGGAFSFAANAGYMTNDAWVNTSWHRIDRYTSWLIGTETAPPSATDERYKRSASTGVFWRQDSPTTTDAALNINQSQIKITLDRMRDGTSQTLMLSENLSNGGWLPRETDAGRGAGTGDLAFGLMVTGSAATPNLKLDEIGASNFTLTESPTNEQLSRINKNLTAATGTAPRPSSFHPQVVNVIFCDGHGQALSQGISDSVYARLLTPNGNSYGQAILSENSF